MATAEGHLDARRQGIQSTRPPAVEDPECSFPVGNIRHAPGAAISVMISPAKREVDIDPTGRLPIHTEWGGDYHVVFYHHDSNYIHVEMAKDRNKKTLAAALQQGIDFFKDHDMDSTYAILDTRLDTSNFSEARGCICSLYYPTCIAETWPSGPFALGRITTSPFSAPRI
jgi:hypothetical protein